MGGDYQWLIDGGKGGRNLDARIQFFYQATANTPAMVLKMVGVGSQYAIADHDKDGNFLDGSKSYKLNIPANAPAKDFWSVILYDPQTRSELQTGQLYPNKNSKRDDLIKNADGSVGPLRWPDGSGRKREELAPVRSGQSLVSLSAPLWPAPDVVRQTARGSSLTGQGALKASRNSRGVTNSTLNPPAVRS